MNRRRLFGCTCALLIAIFVVFLVGRALLYPMHIAACRASGRNDLSPAWFACEAFAHDNGGFFPPLDPEPGRLVFERNIMHKKYSMNGRLLTMEYDRNAPYSWKTYEINPALKNDPNLIDDHSWWYLGYRVSNETEGQVFLKAYLKKVLDRGVFDVSETLTGTDEDGNSIQLPRLRLPVSPGPAASPAKDGEPLPGLDIPVFVERPGHYDGFTGGWVTYLDGHSEFIEFPGKFPMSSQFIECLRAIDMVGECVR